MIRLRRIRDDESGMSYVFIGMGMMAFLSASMLAIDVGMLMTARNQAQNSADAGALAGATALVYDDYDDRSPTGPAVTQRARRRGAPTRSWAATSRSQPADVEFPNDPAGAAEPRQGDGVPHRARGNPVVDADRAVLRHHDGRHRRDRDGRSLAGQRDDLREAVHDSRPVDRAADAALGSGRHASTSSTKGQAAGQPRHLHRPATETGYTGYNAERDKGMRDHAQGGQRHQDRAELLLSAGRCRASTGGADYRWNIAQLQHQTMMRFGDLIDSGARQHGRADHAGHGAI